MDSQELSKILKEHAIWLKNPSEGKRANLKGANIVDANMRGANLRETNLEGADLRGADLKSVILINAELRGVNLEGANLSGAGLRLANLEGVNLSGADLRGADLEGADIFDTEIISFQAGKHFAFYHKGKQYKDGDYLRIGCHGYSLKYWITNYKKIGQKENYTHAHINLYYSFMFLFKTNI